MNYSEGSSEARMTAEMQTRVCAHEVLEMSIRDCARNHSYYLLTNKLPVFFQCPESLSNAYLKMIDNTYFFGGAI